MFTSKHSEFIVTPLFRILESGIDACRGIPNGIESYPLCEYVMQSLFLRMTGAQEQKLKCICWDMATNDYEYRREYINDKNLGECSTYEAKTKIYADLLSQLQAKPSKVDNAYVKKVKNEICGIFEGTFFQQCLKKEFLVFKGEWITKYKNITFINGDNFKNCYEEIVYKHRNRCAHNTFSFQQNLPVFDKLADEEYKYQNYFFRFAILLLIDEMFIETYAKYRKNIFG